MKIEDIITAEEYIQNYYGSRFPENWDKRYDILENMSVNQLKEIMTGFVKQFIDLAAEEAVTSNNRHEISEESYWKVTVVDKQSILNIKELIR
jgi:hypothetical protein